jgi:hypothetical protein
LLVEANAEGDVVVNGHGKRRRLLEHHADLGAKQIQILLWAEHVRAVEQNLTVGPLVGVEVVDAIDDAEQRGLAATGRADEGRDLVQVEIDVDVGERPVFAVIEVEVAHRDLVYQPFGRSHCFVLKFSLDR